MSHAQRARQCAQIHRVLEQAFAVLPTLISYSTDFELLITVMLTANTTDAQVGKVTPLLFARYPTPQRMAAVQNCETLQKIIHSVGLARTKSKSIRATAKIIAAQYNGVVPLTMEALLTLPGVGRKTASVVLCTLKNEPSVIVDTHFARVVRRIGVSAGSAPQHIERDIKALLAPQKWCSFSQRVNTLGRKYCSARNPNCAICPIRPYCQYGKK